MPNSTKGTTQNFLDGPKQRGSFLLGGRTAQTTALQVRRRRRRRITARQYQTVQTSTPSINTQTLSPATTRRVMPKPLRDSADASVVGDLP